MDLRSLRPSPGGFCSVACSKITRVLGLADRKLKLVVSWESRDKCKVRGKITWSLIDLKGWCVLCELTHYQKKDSWGPGGGSLGKGLTVQDPQDLYRNLGTEACSCNPRGRKAEVGGFPGFAKLVPG